MNCYEKACRKLALGLDENTIVVYSADQGWMGGSNGLWGMGDHTRPMAAFDGMIHIPMIFRHPSRIAPGGTSDILVSNYDFLPTVLSYLGLSKALDGVTPRSPGRDFSPVLLSQKIPWENTVYYEMESVRAIRTDCYKYVHRLDGPFELYDLEHDPYEKFNLYGQPSHADTLHELKQRLDRFFVEYSDPKYDLYHGGTSKASLLSHRGIRAVEVSESVEVPGTNPLYAGDTPPPDLRGLLSFKEPGGCLQYPFLPTPRLDPLVFPVFLLRLLGSFQAALG